jgi:spore coat protein U-like protein
MIKAAAAGAALLVAATPASAAVTTTNLSVTANVAASCTVSATALAFGTYNSLAAANDDVTTTMNVACTPGTTWTATAGLGAGTGATFAVRKLTIASTTNTLNYTLYTDSARTILWGDGVAPNGSYTGTGTGATQANTIYGRIPGSQNTAAVGSYTDTVAVTVTF